jgi:hypothetical protein
MKIFDVSLTLTALMFVVLIIIGWLAGVRRRA